MGAVVARLGRGGLMPPLPKSAKVKHVRAASQTRPHHCHWPGCPKHVPPAAWGCKYHWMRLPKPLRDRVWVTYVPGQEDRMDPSREYLRVADEVQAWIRLHFPCAACLGSGVSSKDGPCVPCNASGVRQG